MGGFSGGVQNSWGHKCLAWAPGSPQAAGPPQQPPWDRVSPIEGPGALSLLHMGNSQVLGTEDPPGVGSGGTRPRVVVSLPPEVGISFPHCEGLGATGRVRARLKEPLPPDLSSIVPALSPWGHFLQASTDKRKPDVDTTESS